MRKILFFCTSKEKTMLVRGRKQWLKIKMKIIRKFEYEEVLKSDLNIRTLAKNNFVELLCFFE